jgi:hypothetical protein
VHQFPRWQLQNEVGRGITTNNLIDEISWTFDLTWKLETEAVKSNHLTDKSE